AVIDNFSRRILAWKLAARREPQDTCAVLAQAAKELAVRDESATVVVDSGVENVNGAVDDLIGLGQLRRVLRFRSSPRAPEHLVALLCQVQLRGIL
ncbi:MAG: hypothetical protein ABI560_13295, partial [Myxococcales bacterium]